MPNNYWDVPSTKLPLKFYEATYLDPSKAPNAPKTLLFDLSTYSSATPPVSKFQPPPNCAKKCGGYCPLITSEHAKMMTHRVQYPESQLQTE